MRAMISVRLDEDGFSLSLGHGINKLRNNAAQGGFMWDIIAIVAVYFILVQFVFPKLGVPT